MTNNDILRRLRYTFSFNDNQMIELFAMGGITVTRQQVSNWLKKDDDDYFENINDKMLATFLNGFIISKRGENNNKPTVNEESLNNNVIFRKIKIALNLKDIDILSIISDGGINISKHELSAFFRAPGQQQYRKCNDQILRYFLKGLQLHYNLS